MNHDIVESRVPYTSPMIQYINDLVIHEFDRSMEIFSIGLDHDLIMDRLISKVRIKRTIIGFRTYTDKRHHGISADILARKWSI